MAELINLRRARKDVKRAQAEQTAQQNRALHGRTKAERARDEGVAAGSERYLDAHRREAADK